jgi:hypothetical protein
MKKIIVAAALLAASSATSGCAANQNAVQSESIKVAYVKASDYGHQVGEVAGKCDKGTKKAVKYVGTTADKTVPTSDHPVWNYLAELDCSGNTDSNGSYKLFEAAAPAAPVAQAVAAAPVQVAAATSGDVPSASAYVPIQNAPAYGTGIYVGGMELKVQAFDNPKNCNGKPGYARKFWRKPTDGSIRPLVVTYNNKQVTQEEVQSAADYLNKVYPNVQNIPGENPGYDLVCADAPKYVYAQPNKTVTTAAAKADPCPEPAKTTAKAAPKKVAKKKAPKLECDDPCLVTMLKQLGFSSTVDFQKANGLSTDGCGPKTRAAIMKSFKATEKKSPAPATK